MNKFALLFIAFFIFIFHYSIVKAENPATPEKLVGGKIITILEVKKLLSKNAKVFDVRNELEYSEGHIPGAINIPYKEKSEKVINFDPGIDRFDLNKLPKEKNTPIIFYCNGEKCWKSYKSSVTALKTGYNNIHWFRKGMPEWILKGFPVEK